MARRPPPSARRKAPGPRGRGAHPPARGHRVLVGVAGLLVATALACAGAWWWVSAPERAVKYAEEAARSGKHERALEAWRAVNRGDRPRPAYLKAEARAALALGRAAEAESTLRRATEFDPEDPEAWRLRLERLRVLDRPLEAQEIGWKAYASVSPEARRGVLRELTLALLASLPDDLARKALARWARAEGGAPDSDARVALLARMAAMPSAGDPDRPERLAELGGLIASSPGNLPAREAYIADCLDGGDVDHARAALDAWPGQETERDARYWRLRGRLDLDHGHDPGAAAKAFERTLTDLPHDWKTRVRLARAEHALGREAESRREAEVVSRTREALEPNTLGPRLAADFDRPDDPGALAELAELCARVGLSRLAEAWRSEAVAVRANNGHVPQR